MQRVEILIAYRYLRFGVRNGFASAAALFSFLGITIGVAALIIVTSVMNGFRKEFSDIVTGFQGHIVAHYYRYDDALLDVPRARSVIGVRDVVLLSDNHAMISANKNIFASLVLGIDPQSLQSHQLVSDNIISGSLENFANAERQIVLGNSLARRLNVSVGDFIEIISPQFEETGLGIVPLVQRFKICALFQSGMQEYDANSAFIDIAMSQKMFSNNHLMMALFLRENADMHHVMKVLRNAGIGQHLSDWQSSNGAFMNAVAVERNVMFLILTLIVLVASFNIISSLVMLVRDKEKSIAILKTIGLNEKALLRIFMMIGMSIGLFGIFCGCLCGICFAKNIENIRQFLQSLLSCELFSAEVYYLTRLPSVLHYEDVFIIVSIALVLAVLATLYPAYKASKLNPVEVLRYG